MPKLISMIHRGQFPFCIKVCIYAYLFVVLHKPKDINDVYLNYFPKFRKVVDKFIKMLHNYA